MTIIGTVQFSADLSFGIYPVGYLVLVIRSLCGGCALQIIGAARSFFAALPRNLGESFSIPFVSIHLAELTGRMNQAEMALRTAMEAAKLKSFKLDGGPNLTLASKWVYALPPKDEPERRAEALAWLRRVGARNLIEPNIHPQTMTAFLRERREDGKAISPLLRETELRYLSVRKD